MKREQKLKVFVIDDNQDDLMMIERVAKRMELTKPFELESFTNASSAFAALESGVARPPAVIILDYNLEGARAESAYRAEGLTTSSMTEIWRSRLASLNFVRKLREHPRLKRVPVVMYTSSKLDGDLEGAYDAGINSYVHKEMGEGTENFMEEIESILSYWIDFNVGYLGGV